MIGATGAFGRGLRGHAPYENEWTIFEEKGTKRCRMDSKTTRNHVAAHRVYTYDRCMER
jgi:hypothetical protein